MKTTHLKILTTLILLLGVIGCSKQSPEAEATKPDDEAPEVGSREMAAGVDKMCEEVLQSADKLEAADWLKRYPKSAVGEDEDGRPVLLAPVVARLREAGAQRVVIEFVKLGQAELLVSLIVVLPADAPARQKLFALEPELSQLCQQTPMKDYGQKYLHYSFD